MEDLKMITETEILQSSDGHIVKEIEIVRPLNNRELEERLYELTQIFIDYINNSPQYHGDKEFEEQLLDRLDKLREDFS